MKSILNHDVEGQPLDLNEQRSDRLDYPTTSDLDGGLMPFRIDLHSESANTQIIIHTTICSFMRSTETMKSKTLGWKGETTAAVRRRSDSNVM